MSGPADADGLLAATLREEAGRVVASLTRRFDFDVAEEATQTALVEALVSWRADGPPDRPGAWLQRAAHRNALDLVRASGRRDALAQRAPAPAQSSTEPSSGTDDRLALLFGCCHPALAPEVRLGLTLRAVIGLTTAQIARAFLVPETTLAARITRAKKKIVASGITMAVPEGEALDERLDDVLTVVWVMFNEAYLSTTGTQDRDLAADAVWLADVVATSLPRHAEAWGLAALLRLQHARRDARFSADGTLVLLAEQDRSRWDRAEIARADDLLERAAKLRDPGRFQIQAAIAACHATASSWNETDWFQIATLYDLLLAHDPSSVVRLNRAVALSFLGPHQAATALTEIDALPDRERLEGYHLFHATRAALLRAVGRSDEAREADERALMLTGNEAEQRLLRDRLA